MEISHILAAKNCLNKIIPFFKGTSSSHPDIDEFPKELSEKLDAILKGAREHVNLQEKELIFHFIELHSFIDSLSSKIGGEYYRIHDGDYNPDNVSELQFARYEFFKSFYPLLYKFLFDLEKTYWGIYLQHKDYGVTNHMFSPKKHWPEKIKAFHVGVRTHLLESQNIIDPLLKMYGTQLAADSALAEYYGFDVTTIERNFREARKQLKLSPDKRTSQRNTQLQEVIYWLEREGFFDVAKKIKV